MASKLKVQNNKGLWHGRFLTFETIESTNQWVLDNPKQCFDGDVVYAIEQTAGHGRFQRKWISQPERSITMSMVIWPQSMHDPILQGASMSTALAVRATLQEYNIESMVKWPNDVLADGRKTAGILAEYDSSHNILVIGIGINVNMTANDLSDPCLNQQHATSMSIQTAHGFNIAEVIASLIKNAETVINNLRKTGFEQLLTEWTRYDYLAGRKILVSTKDGFLSGSYSGLNENGKLRIIDENGQEHTFWTGDVSIKNID